MLSVLAMINGEIPNASMLARMRLSGFMYAASSRREAREDVRKEMIQMALHAWEMIVAKAAPFTPMLKVKIKRGSSRILSMAPIMTDHMAMDGRP